MSQTMWTVTTVVAVLGCVLFGWILKKLIKAYQKVDENYQPLQLQFKYAAADVKGEDRRFSLLFVPMLFYAGLALAVVTHNASAVAWVRQAMYVLACIGTGASFKKRHDPVQILLPVTVLGGFLYHAIFEAKSQYIFVYAFFMMPLAAQGLCVLEKWLMEKLRGLKEKKRKAE